MHGWLLGFRIEGLGFSDNETPESPDRLHHVSLVNQRFIGL